MTKKSPMKNENSVGNNVPGDKNEKCAPSTGQSGAERETVLAETQNPTANSAPEQGKDEGGAQIAHPAVETPQMAESSVPEQGDAEEVQAPEVMPIHDLASLFPRLGEQELTALADDIEKNGQNESIVTYEGQVLDGQNRQSACLMRGIRPNYVEYTGTDPLGFVLSKNLRRRQLNESQRAMVAARLANMGQGERKKGKPANLPVSEPAANGREISQSEAARILNVSERLVRSATKLRKKATPEVIAQVEQGAMTINAALPKGTPKEGTQSKAPATKQESDKVPVPPVAKPDVEPSTEPMASTDRAAEGVQETGNVPETPTVEVPTPALSPEDRRILGDFEKALKLPRDSQELSKAFVDVCTAFLNERFTRESLRRDVTEVLHAKWKV